VADRNNNAVNSAGSLNISRGLVLFFMAITKFLVKSRNNNCNFLNYKS